MITFHSEIKVLPIDPVFSNWVNFHKKVSIINISTNSKSVWQFIFFEIQKLKVCEKKTSQFCFSFLAFITLFQLSVGYV